jgi:hypothetical protein
MHEGRAGAAREAPAHTDWRVWLGLSLTVGWLVAASVYIETSIGWGGFFHQSLADLGQFLEGAVAPLAFLWLVLGLFLQQSELAANSEAIRRQYEVMLRTAEQAEIQTQAIAANELHARQDTFIDLSHLVSLQLEVIAGLLFLSSQGPGGDGVVSEAEIDSMWSRMSSGEASLFTRRLIGLHFGTDHERASWELFWGTPIRARHCQTFIQSFERLLRAAEGCDPERMIVDALRGNAQGRLYAIMCELRDRPPPGA